MEKICTRQPVLTAERNVKFHSSQTVPDQYTAESATVNEDHREDSRLRPSGCSFSSLIFLFFLYPFVIASDVA